GPGWKLRVFGTSMNHDGRCYSHNAVLPLSILDSRNGAALLGSGRIGWSDVPGDGPAPRDLPAAAPPKPNPKVEIIVAGTGLDEVATLKATYHDMIRKCDGDEAAARDLILGDRAANGLYQKAGKIDYDRQRRNGTPIGGTKTIWERIR